MAVQAGAMGPRNGMSPALIISAERVAFVVETREKAIRRVADDLVREGERLG